MTQESSTREKVHKFSFANTRFGGNDKAYNERKKEINKKQGKDLEDGSHPNDQNPDNNDDDKENGEESTQSISEHTISRNSTSQQTTPRPTLHKGESKKPKQSQCEEAKSLTLHPKHLYWYGERTKN